jgi:hypothetical protein
MNEAGKKAEAVAWYRKSLELSNIPALQEEVERRIKTLRN